MSEFYNRDWYKYIDDTAHAWVIRCSEGLADVGGLERIPPENPEKVPFISPNYKPRYINLVGLAERPGMQKYRTEVITNERDPSKLLNRIITVNGMQMRCIRYVGEQRTGY